MIQAQDKANIINFFGKQYSRKLIPQLVKSGVITATGKPFTSRTLNWVVNGNTENLEVENVVFTLMKQLQIERKKIDNLKKKVK